jgi:hypothetical protein
MNVAVGKKLLHISEGKQTHLLEERVDYSRRRLGDDAPYSEAPDKPALERNGKKMDKRSDKMRFDEKFLRGRLNPQRATDAAGLASKSLLTLESAEMLDDTIGENDVKRSSG